ncbi:MAG: MarR family transcriptional regulator [Chitinophagales bacterium]|nr:MarR family transcriptional regulator [Chitinophagales bacterium]
MNAQCTKILEALLLYQKEENLGHNLSDFAYWILDKENRSSCIDVSSSNNSLETNDIEEEISRLLVLMYRYAKGHLKTYLAEFSELNQEDFTYLYALKRAGSLTKTQLIERNVHDRTTGLEVIRRLVKNGLIHEHEDEHDKRSVRIELTKKGEMAFIEIKSITRKVAKLITGKLTAKEKQKMYELLKKLDVFHQPLYLSKTKLELDFVLEKYSLN